MNGRIFVLLRERKIHDWWIGGGYDLTPYLFNRSDTILWHKNSKEFLDNYNQKLYKKFSKIVMNTFICHIEMKEGGWRDFL